MAKYNICTNCQYCRASLSSGRSKLWCSNSKSPNFNQDIQLEDTCPEFYRAGKKVPIWMRIINNILSRR